jgi:hypothetical protein
MEDLLNINYILFCSSIKMKATSSEVAFFLK